MLFFIAPYREKPIGGLKQTYRHAQILSEEGIPARVLHDVPGQRCRWFEHNAPMAWLAPRRRDQIKRWLRRNKMEATYFAKAGDVVLVESEKGEHEPYTLSGRDVFVVPEYRGARLEGVLSDFPLVVFNQNAHNTFRYYPAERRRSGAIYSQDNVLGAITVSKHNQQYLEFAFPRLSVARVVNGVDETLFHPAGKKQRRIAFMPRKMPEDLAEVFNILSARATLDGWTLSPIDGMNERQVADEMRRSLVYLSTCQREGFGLPPVEAGMSGCLVVGYTGAAAAEYMDPEYCHPVAQQDTLGFARQLEETLRFCEEQPDAAEKKGLAFAEVLARTYSLSEERRSVIEAWRPLLQGKFDTSS